MRSYRVAIGIAVLLALSLLTYSAFRERARDEGSATELSGLLSGVEAEAIERVEIRSPRRASVTLERQGDELRLVEPVEGRADEQAIAALFEALAEIEVTGVAATRSDNHGRLGVDKAQAISLEVLGKGGKPLLQLLVGRYLPEQEETLVRLPDEERVLSVAGFFSEPLERELLDWRHRIFFGVEPDQVTSIRFDCPQGSFAFTKQGDEFRPAEGQKPIEGYDPEQVWSRVMSLARFRGSDFADPAVGAAEAGTGPDSRWQASFEVGGDSPRSHTLRFGEFGGIVKRHDGSDKRMFYVQHDDDPVVYRTSEYLRDRLCPTAQALSKDAQVALPSRAAAAARPTAQHHDEKTGGEAPRQQ